jgi:hypothetical protein
VTDSIDDELLRSAFNGEIPEIERGDDRIEDAPHQKRGRKKKPRKPLSSDLPLMQVYEDNPKKTVDAIIGVLKKDGGLYERNGACRPVYSEAEGGVTFEQATVHSITYAVHSLVQPYVVKEDSDGDPYDRRIALPERPAAMYLALPEMRDLPAVAGVTTAPLLRENGDIVTAAGHDPVSKMYVDNCPDIASRVPARPTKEQAKSALRRLREPLTGFPFEDAKTAPDEDGIRRVDLETLPGMDESCALNILMTTVCRASLHLSPGGMCSAPENSGSGSGKGKFVRLSCEIAFGRQPAAAVAGADVTELDKRLVAMVIAAQPAILIDNVNSQALKSDQLASAITENPSRFRPLGTSNDVIVTCKSMIFVNGNGLSTSEDLSRRFIHTKFNAHIEEADSRPFKGDLLAEVKDRREELLIAALTIWRWGRQSKPDAGLPIGSFGQWSRWVRDPLLALGCKDPALRIREAKQIDASKEATRAVFELWWARHPSKDNPSSPYKTEPVSAADLDFEVKELLRGDRKGISTRFYSTRLTSMTGTYAAGFVLHAAEKVGAEKSKAGRLYHLEMTAQHPDRQKTRKPADADASPPVNSAPEPAANRWEDAI